MIRRLITLFGRTLVSSVARPMNYHGHIQSGGEDSKQPWVPALCSLAEEHIAFVVNDIEVARLSRSKIELVDEESSIYAMAAPDGWLFFLPCKQKAVQT